jgi:L-asparagine transporter-like permease
MIAIAGTIGTGLFLGSGSALVVSDMSAGLTRR